MSVRVALRVLILFGVAAPHLADAQAPIRRVVLSIHNAPPGDSAAAARVFRVALERDSTVLVVAPRTSADVRKNVYQPIQYFMDVSYRNDAAGERLVCVVLNVETGALILRDSVRYIGPARSLTVPPVQLPPRPPNPRWY